MINFAEEGSILKTSYRFYMAPLDMLSVSAMLTCLPSTIHNAFGVFAYKSGVGSSLETIPGLFSYQLPAGRTIFSQGFLTFNKCTAFWTGRCFFLSNPVLIRVCYITRLIAKFFNFHISQPFVATRKDGCSARQAMVGISNIKSSYGLRGFCFTHIFRIACY